MFIARQWWKTKVTQLNLVPSTDNNYLLDTDNDLHSGCLNYRSTAGFSRPLSPGLSDYTITFHLCLEATCHNFSFTLN